MSKKAAHIGGLQDAQPKGIAGAALKSCCFCGAGLASMGGGGSWLCEDCYIVITSDYTIEGVALRDAWAKIRRERKT